MAVWKEKTLTNWIGYRTRKISGLLLLVETSVESRLKKKNIEKGSHDRGRTIDMDSVSSHRLSAPSRL